jgi:hypothetical protein
MGNLEFNTQNVTRFLRLANSTSNWVSNSQTPVQIVQAGYVRDLEVFLNGATTTTTNPATMLDTWAPWGVINNFQVNSNVQAGIINLSGIAVNWVDQVLEGLEHMGNSPDTNLVVPQGVSAAQLTSQYSVPSSTGAGTLQLPYWIPLAQKINTLDGYVGIWDLQDPSIQMILNYTPNSPTAASPFSIIEGAAATGSGLFTQAASTGVTVTTPSMLVTRLMYDPPVDPRDDPDFGFVHSFYEETWNTGLAGSKVINWKALANSGYITKLIFGVFDSTGPAGLADTQGTLTNFINFTVGNNAPVIVETIYETRFRQSYELGHYLPQGVYYIDFLGGDLTMQNVLDTFTAGNINLQMNFVNALGGTSSGKVIRGMLQALQQ